MSEVFRLGVSEREVVNVILAGTRCAEVRALLVLALPPSTLGEVDVCIRLPNIGSYRGAANPGSTGVLERN